MKDDTQLNKDIPISEEVNELGVSVRSFALNSSDALSRAVVAADIVGYQEIGFNNAIFGYVPIFRTKELAIQAAIGGQLTNILPYWVNGGSVGLSQPITNFKYLIVTGGFAGDGSGESTSITIPPFLFGKECVLHSPTMLEEEYLKFVVSGNILSITANRSSTGKTSNNKITSVYGVS